MVVLFKNENLSENRPAACIIIILPEGDDVRIDPAIIRKQQHSLRLIFSTLKSTAEKSKSLYTQQQSGDASDGRVFWFSFPICISFHDRYTRHI